MNYNTKSTLVFALLVVVAILAIIFGPLAVIFSLNNLFPVLAIPYNFYTWLSVVILNLTWMYKPTVSKD